MITGGDVVGGGTVLKVDPGALQVGGGVADAGALQVGGGVVVIGGLATPPGSTIDGNCTFCASAVRAASSQQTANRPRNVQRKVR